MDKLKALWKAVVDILDPAGDWVALLPIRLLMAYEFFKAGLTKFNGSNWFGNVQDNFPFPFNVLPVEISWFLATWTELIGGLCLFIGLFTRFWAFSLIILTIVAIFGVHWEGLRHNGQGLRQLPRAAAVPRHAGSAAVHRRRKAERRSCTREEARIRQGRCRAVWFFSRLRHMCSHPDRTG
jgi:putative oxidoreductase